MVINEINRPELIEILSETFGNFSSLLLDDAIIHGLAINSLIAGLPHEGELEVLLPTHLLVIQREQVYSCGTWHFLESRKGIIRLEGMYGQRLTIKGTANVHQTIDKSYFVCNCIGSTKYGQIIEVVKNAYEDCKNGVIRINNYNVELGFDSLMSEISRYTKRGWKLAISLDLVKKNFDKLRQVYECKERSKLRRKRAAIGEFVTMREGSGWRIEYISPPDCDWSPRVSKLISVLEDKEIKHSVSLREEGARLHIGAFTSYQMDLLIKDMKHALLTIRETRKKQPKLTKAIKSTKHKFEIPTPKGIPYKPKSYKSKPKPKPPKKAKTSPLIDEYPAFIPTATETSASAFFEPPELGSPETAKPFEPPELGSSGEETLAKQADDIIGTYAKHYESPSLEDIEMPKSKQIDDV
ncbi:MAG: hypothetical protein PVG39_20900 [Desulfobacteraceae bacterium]|jgi:hypothetical protein